MPVGNWIYEITSGTPGGGTTPPPYIPPDAPPVTISTAEVEELYDGRFEVRVNWTPAATANSSNFKGVNVYLEDPDLSETKLTPMDDTVTLDGTAQLAGKWAPTHLTDTSASPADIKIPGEAAERFIRVYLQGYNKIVNATLTRANEPNATPSIRITIPARRASYVKGMEYVWLITDPAVTVVPDFENSEGPKYSMRFSFTEPDDTIPLPPGMLKYGGVQTVYKYPTEGNREATARFLTARQPDTWISDAYPARTIKFQVYFCSAADTNRVNTIVPGVTPMVEVSVVYPPLGENIAPPVTGFTISNLRHATQPDGTIYALADLKWTPPDSTRYALVEFYRIGIVPPRKLDYAGNKSTQLTLAIIDYPKVAEDWTIAAISVDFNNKLADDPANLGPLSPTVIWHIGPPGPGGSGQEYTPPVAITGTTVTTEQELNSDGVVMMRHIIKGWTNSTENSFGGVSVARVIAGDNPNTGSVTWWDVPKNQNMLTTDWEPAPAARSWDFFLVSRDQQGKRNTIFLGITAKITIAFTPAEGDIKASRMPEDWWDPTEFAWPAYPDGAFEAKQFVARKIYVGSILRVGGGPSGAGDQFAGFENGQIVVYNASNVMRAWAGEHVAATPDNATPHPIYGGWFSELYIGGDDPTTAPIYANNAGIVIIGGFDIKGARYPMVSIRRHDGIEVGRLGARIGQGLVAPADPAYIAGGWFKEFAVGGQSLADWRILARRDPTDPATGSDLVNIRDINKFTIDYRQNYPSGTNPSNAAMHLEFGYDAFVADVASPNYNKFAGFQIVRTGTQHSATLINRGLILSAVGSPARRAALITYNGDVFGGDLGQFWAELTMMSPANGATNVILASGTSGSGASFFKLSDQSGTQNFYVDGLGNVTIRGTLTLSTLTLSGAMSAAQYFITPSTQVITPGGQFNGPGGVNTIGSITASGFIRSDGSYWLGGNQFITYSGVNVYVQAFQYFATNPSRPGIGGQFKDQIGRTITFQGGILVDIQ